MEEKDTYVHVLDKGLVRLVDCMGNDLSIVRSARVSYDADWRPGDQHKKNSDNKLIRYLLLNGHTTPFEAVTFTFELKMPIFLARQWHRHRTWCLAGNTEMVFNTPGTGRAHRMRIADFASKWNAPLPKRQRGGRTLREFNQQRLGGMQLRAPTGSTNVTDAWHSGEKQIYRLHTKAGTVLCSKDHVFKTPYGTAKLSDNPSEVMGMVSLGTKKQEPFSPQLTSNEIAKERWVEFEDGYEVSDLGRVRSYWGRGRRSKSRDPQMKKQCKNNVGRMVVSTKSGAVQVSRTVLAAFEGESSEFALHRDDNPLNNKLSNLRWGTAKDNAEDCFNNGNRQKLGEHPVKVDKITKAGVEDTFDISVTGDHWFVANNLVVHNSYNEVSARYAELDMGYYAPEPERIGVQSADNKQVREFTDLSPQQLVINEITAKHMDTAMDLNFTLYKRLIEDGVPTELARIVLPVSAYTRFFGTVNLHNLFHFLKLRLHSHAQWEIRQYAEAMLELIEPEVPVAVAAFKEKIDYTPA